MVFPLENSVRINIGSINEIGIAVRILGHGGEIVGPIFEVVGRLVVDLKEHVFPFAVSDRSGVPEFNRHIGIRVQDLRRN